MFDFTLPDSVQEGGVYRFTITPQAALREETELSWKIVLRGYLPTAGEYFSAMSGTVSFAARASTGRDVTISLNDNARASFNKNFTIEIIEDFAVLASQEVTLTDDDTRTTPPARTISDNNNDTASIYTIGSTEGGTYSKSTSSTTDNDEYIITRYQRTDVTINDTSTGNVIKFDYGVTIIGFTEGMSNTATLTLDTGAMVTINEGSLNSRYEYFVGEDRHADYTAFKTAIGADSITAEMPFTVETAASAALTRATYDIPTTTGDVVGTHDDDVVAVGRDANLVVDAGPGDDIYVVTRFQFGDILIADNFGKNLIKLDYGVTITDYDEASHFFFGVIDAVFTLSTGATIKIDSPRANFYSYQIGDGAVITYDEFKTEIGATGTNDTSALSGNYQTLFPSELIQGPEQIVYDDNHGEGAFPFENGSGNFAIAEAVFGENATITFSMTGATATTDPMRIGEGFTHQVAVRTATSITFGTLYYDSTVSTAEFNNATGSYQAKYLFAPNDQPIRDLTSNDNHQIKYSITASASGVERSHDFLIVIRGKNDFAKYLNNFNGDILDNTVKATVTEDNGTANSDGADITVRTTGTLKFTDFDSDNTLLVLHAKPINGTSKNITSNNFLDGEYGRIEFFITAPTSASDSGTLEWTYTLTNTDSRVQALGPDSPETIDAFELTLTDGNGLVSPPLNLNIEIMGAVDGTPPTLTAPDDAFVRDTEHDDRFEIFTGSIAISGSLAITLGGNTLTSTAADENSIGGRMGFTHFVEGTHGALFFTHSGNNFAYRYFPDDAVAGVARTETFSINGADLAFTLNAGISYGAITQGQFHAEDDGTTITYQVNGREIDNSITGFTHSVAGKEEGKYGSLHYNHNSGRWIYLANSTEIDLLTADEEITETFTLKAIDDQGNASTSSEDLTITLIGDNEASYLHSGTTGSTRAFTQKTVGNGGDAMRYGNLREVTNNDESDALKIFIKAAGVGNRIEIASDTDTLASAAEKHNTRFADIGFQRSNTDGAGELFWFYNIDRGGPFHIDANNNDNTIDRIKVTVLDTFGYETSEFITINNRHASAPGDLASYIAPDVTITGDFEVYESHPLDNTTSGIIKFGDARTQELLWVIQLTGSIRQIDENTGYDGAYGNLNINRDPSSPGEYSFTYRLTSTIAQLDTADSVNQITAGTGPNDGDGSFDSGEVLYDTFYLRTNDDRGKITWINVEFEIKGLNDLEGDSFFNFNLSSPNTASAGINELIDGGAGDDTITTGRGRDVVAGGFGDDTINLGADQKTVVHRFTSADTGGWRLDDSGDTINGFKFGIDKLVLVDRDGTSVDLAGFIANAPTAPNNVIVRVVGNDFSEINGIDLVFSRRLSDDGLREDQNSSSLKIRYLEPLVIQDHAGNLNALGMTLLGATPGTQGSYLDAQFSLTEFTPLARYFDGNLDVKPIGEIDTAVVDFI